MLNTFPLKKSNKYVSALYPEFIYNIRPLRVFVIIKLPAIYTLSLSENV